MKSWKTPALVAVALLCGTSALATQPIRSTQAPSLKSNSAAALSLTRAGPKMRGASKLAGDDSLATFGLVAAGLVAAYFLYTEVIDDDDDEPASP